MESCIELNHPLIRLNKRQSVCKPLTQSLHRNERRKEKQEFFYLKLKNCQCFFFRHSVSLHLPFKMAVVVLLLPRTSSV